MVEKEFERIKNKYKPLIETWKEDCEVLKDIDFLINILDTMNKRAKMNKVKFNSLYGKMVAGGYTQIKFEKYIPESKIKSIIKELEKEQEQNRKELARGIDYLSNEMIESASKKIGINLSIREYLQLLIKEDK